MFLESMETEWRRKFSGRYLLIYELWDRIEIKLLGGNEFSNTFCP
jgi:hypothetical protein